MIILDNDVSILNSDVIILNKDVVILGCVDNSRQGRVVFSNERNPSLGIGNTS